MKQWRSTLELSDLLKKREKGEINIIDLGTEVAKRIRRLSCFKREEIYLADIASNFEEVENDIDAFDDILNDLYDWADEDKKCWINT